MTDKELQRCKKPLHSLHKLAFGSVQLSVGPLASVLLYWVVYLAQAGTIVAMAYTHSHYQDPVTRVGGVGISVSHTADAPATYYFVVVVILCFFTLMVVSDYMNLVVVTSEEDISACECRMTMLFTVVVILSGVMSIAVMVLVGWVMAARATVAHVVGNALSIFIVLQIDDVTKDFFNTSLMAIWAKNPDRRSIEIIETFHNEKASTLFRLLRCLVIVTCFIGGLVSCIVFFFVQ